MLKKLKVGLLGSIFGMVISMIVSALLSMTSLGEGIKVNIPGVMFLISIIVAGVCLTIAGVIHLINDCYKEGFLAFIKLFAYICGLIVIETGYGMLTGAKDGTNWLETIGGAAVLVWFMYSFVYILNGNSMRDYRKKNR